ncbi:MAG: hypothetical protein ABS882_04755 [Lysinibacillus sp.]
MIKKVHYHCVYTYECKGKVESDTYQSDKHSYNTTDPFHIMRALQKEIREVTGRTVKDFMTVGKTPIGTVYEYKRV